MADRNTQVLRPKSRGWQLEWDGMNVFIRAGLQIVFTWQEEWAAAVLRRVAIANHAARDHCQLTQIIDLKVSLEPIDGGLVRVHHNARVVHQNVQILLLCNSNIGRHTFPIENERASHLSVQAGIRYWEPESPT